MSTFIPFKVHYREFDKAVNIPEELTVGNGMGPQAMTKGHMQRHEDTGNDMGTQTTPRRHREREEAGLLTRG